MKTIYIAGGCFWGVEAYFAQLKGVVSTEVGYAQGDVAHPTYEAVCSGLTGHTETVKIVFDDDVLTIPMLLEHMLRFVDPHAINRQGNDVGTQYRSGVYYVDEKDGDIVRDFLEKLQDILPEPIVIEIEPMRSYYSGEAYHQAYLEKNPHGYCHVNLNLVQPSERK